MPNSYGLCSRQGSRPYQEDRLAVSTSEVEHFSALSQQQQKSVLSGTVAAMQKAHGKKRDVGSTLCTVTAWTERDPATNQRKVKTSCANLGDSRAYLVVGNAESSRIIMLNAVHNPELKKNQTEYERILKKGRIKKYGRSDYLYMEGWFSQDYLAVSRSIGDTKFESAGLSHEPEITFKEELLQEGEQAFILVASDGADRLPCDEIKSKIFRASSLSAAAEGLVGHALLKNGKKSDNVSLAIVEVEDSPVSAIVLDGHGGDSVSEAVQLAFYPSLKSHIDRERSAQHTAILRNSDTGDISEEGADMQKLPEVSVDVFPIVPTVDSPEDKKDVKLATPHEIPISETEKKRLEQAFFKLHRHIFSGESGCCFFSFCRNTKTKADWDLKKIIEHAMSADNRSRRVCELLGWLNKGKMADGAPEYLKTVANSFSRR